MVRTEIPGFETMESGRADETGSCSQGIASFRPQCVMEWEGKGSESLRKAARNVLQRVWNSCPCKEGFRGGVGLMTATCGSACAGFPYDKVPLCKQILA